MVDTTARPSSASPTWSSEEVGSVLLELTVVEQRFNAVMEVLRDGLTVVEVAERYGVSRQAVHGWLRRYAAGGLEGWLPAPTAPTPAPTRCPPTSRPESVSCAATIPIGASAAWPTNWPATASTHRPA
jgi:hypothetical protein